MAALGSQSIAQSYEQLLHVDRDGGGNTTTHVSLKDGDNGTTFGFTIATDALMMTSTNRLEFGDTGTYIHQSADGVLDLVSDTEIELTATTIDINGAVAMDGAMTGGTNITISGELDAATLDISGNADIDGTMEADAYTVDGTALNEFIADTVGAMVGSNTETGIAVTYEDGDNTLDFVLGAAQTTVTSLLAADIKIGEDNETKIDFETPNEIHLYANNVEQVYVADNIFGPNADSDVDLGTTGVRWKDAFVDSITVTGEIDGASLDIEGNADINGTTNLDAVDIDGAVQIDAAFTSGVDGQGYDTKFFGDTSGAYIMWDTSEDDLVFAGAAGLDIAGNIDVDGTANLDIVDIDGALTQDGGNVVFNEASADYDFRVESALSENMFFVDGGNEEVLIQRAASGGTATAGSVLIVEDDDNAEISLLGGSSSILAINFGHSGDVDDAMIQYNTTSGSENMAFTVNATQALAIDSSQNATFAGDVKVNGNHTIEGYSTGRNVIRSIGFSIQNAADAGKIKVIGTTTVGQAVFNSSAISEEDNLALNVAGTNFMYGTGAGSNDHVLLISGGLGGTVVGVLSCAIVSNASGTALNFAAEIVSGGIRFRFNHADDATEADLDVLVNTGIIQATVTYITSS